MKTPLLSLAIALLLASTALAVTPRNCLACSCAEAPEPDGGWTRDTLVADYDTVFRGRVVSAGPLWTDGNGASNGQYPVTIQVEEVWKGATQATIQLGAGSFGADCTVRFWPGQEWLIYANISTLDTRVYATDSCTPTSLLSADRIEPDLAILGIGTPLVSDTVARVNDIGWQIYGWLERILLTRSLWF